MVPTFVVLSGWLQCKILAPFQKEELRGLKNSYRREIKPATHPQLASPLSIERAVAVRKAEIA